MTIFNSRNLKITYETPNTIKIYTLENYKDNITYQNLFINIIPDNLYKLKILNNKIFLIVGENNLI